MKNCINNIEKRYNKVVPYQTYRTLYAPQLSYGRLKWGEERGGEKGKENKQTKAKR